SLHRQPLGVSSLPAEDSEDSSSCTLFGCRSLFGGALTPASQVLSSTVEKYAAQSCTNYQRSKKCVHSVKSSTVAMVGSYLRLWIRQAICLWLALVVQLCAGLEELHGMGVE